MKKIIAILALLFLVLVLQVSYAQHAEIDDKLIGLLNRIKWGIDKNEIKDLFRDKKPMPPHPTKNAIGFFDYNYDEASNIICYFNQGLSGRDGF